MGKVDLDANEQLSQHFSRNEFACKCSCGADHISRDLVAKLETVRVLYGKALKVTSGVRCPVHNEAVGGKISPPSEHVKGLAADLLVRNSSERFRLMGLCINEFPRVGVAKDFIHVDIASDKSRHVLWTY